MLERVLVALAMGIVVICEVLDMSIFFWHKWVGR